MTGTPNFRADSKTRCKDIWPYLTAIVWPAQGRKSTLTNRKDRNSLSARRVVAWLPFRSVKNPHWPLKGAPTGVTLPSYTVAKKLSEGSYVRTIFHSPQFTGLPGSGLLHGSGTAPSNFWKGPGEGRFCPPKPVQPGPFRILLSGVPGNDTACSVGWLQVLPTILGRCPSVLLAAHSPVSESKFRTKAQATQDPASLDRGLSLSSGLDRRDWKS